MSFKEYPSSTQLANLALGMISERSISSLDEPGNVAQAVRKWYKPTVARLLETHHWGLATKRMSPVATVANERSAEWQFSFTTPDDMAFPVGFALPSGASTVSYYRGLGSLLGLLYGKPIFEYVGNRIYTNIAGDLDYVSYEITEADFNATFANIVVLTLASRLALELPKDYELFKALEQKAVEQINIAITHNLNAGRQRYGAFTSESELVRGSGYGENWDYIPRGPAS